MGSGLWSVHLHACAITCTCVHTHADICAYTHVCVYTVWLCLKINCPYFGEGNLGWEKWVLSHKQACWSCAIFLNNKKKLNIENIKDLTQSLCSLKLFRVLCLCLVFYMFVSSDIHNSSSFYYVTKLPGVALRDVIHRLCLTGVAFRDVTNNIACCSCVTWRDRESKVVRVALRAVTQRLRCLMLRYVTWNRDHYSLRRVTSCDAENAMRGVTVRDVSLKTSCPVLRYVTWHGEHCDRRCLTYTYTEN